MSKKANAAALTRRLKKTETLLRDILDGKKPSLDPDDPATGWLYKQMDRMYAGHFLAEVPSTYVTLPGEGPAEIALKGVTGFHPVSYRLMKQEQALKLDLDNAGIRNVFMLGTFPLFRSTNPALLAQQRTLAGNFTATRGDLDVLHQLIWHMRANLAAAPENRKLLVLQDKNKFWRPAISGLGLDNEQARAECQLILSGSRKQTKDAILYSGSEPARAATLPALPPVRTLLFASSEPRKAHDTRQIIDHDRWAMTFAAAIRYVHWFMSAPEISKTYEGNALEKIQAVMVRIYDQIGPEQFAKNISDTGHALNATAVIVNDTGNSLTPDVSDRPEFDQSRAEAAPGKPWPGAEFGPILNAQGGTKKFMIDFNTAKNNMGITEPGRYRDTQLYMMARLADRPEDVTIECFFGTETGYMRETPRPDNGVYDTDMFKVPDGQPGGVNGKTKAELGDAFMVTDSAQARALRAYAWAHGVEQSTAPSFNFVAEKGYAGGRALRLATQANWGRTRTPLPAPSLAGDWQSRKRVYSNFETMAPMFDGFLLDRHSPDTLKAFDRHTINLSRLFWKLVTHNQIYDDITQDKAFLVRNPKLAFVNDNGGGGINWDDPATERRFLRTLEKLDPEEHPWGREMLLYTYYHEKSLIKQQPKFIYRQVRDDTELAASLQQARAGFRHHKVIPYFREDYGRDRHDLFEMAIIASAGTRHPMFKESGRFLGYEGAKAGLHIRTGGGQYGVLEAVARGFQDYCDDYPEQAGNTHFSAIQMPRTLQFEGLCFEPASLTANGNRYVAIESGMEPRIASIERSDVVVADACGAGTIEEVLDYFVLKERGVLPPHSAFVFNNHQHLGPQNLRLHDPLLATLPSRVLDDKNVYIEPDAAHTLERVLKLRHDHLHPVVRRSLANLTPT